MNSNAFHILYNCLNVLFKVWNNIQGYFLPKSFTQGIQSVYPLYITAVPHIHTYIYIFFALHFSFSDHTRTRNNNIEPILLLKAVEKWRGAVTQCIHAAEHRQHKLFSYNTKIQRHRNSDYSHCWINNICVTLIFLRQ